jgi:hypothetical protein
MHLTGDLQVIDTENARDTAVVLGMRLKMEL